MAQGNVIAVTGASGFVGGHIVRELLSQGRTVRALVRDGRSAARSLPASPALTLIEGDATDAGSLDRLCKGAAAVIHLIGILREERGGQTFERIHVGATEATLAAAKRAGVKRYIHMSALGVHPEAKAEYQKTKWRAERAVHASGLDWTIFRPGLILGDGAEFIEVAKGWASGHEAPWLFMPYFKRQVEDTSVPLGPMIDIDPSIQPIAVQDVAAAFVKALDTPRTIGETYNLCGPQRVSWPEMLRWIRDNLGGDHSQQPWGIPSNLGIAAAKAAKAVGLAAALPFDEGMAIMGGEDSTADTTKAAEHLGLYPRPFQEAFAHAGAH